MSNIEINTSQNVTIEYQLASLKDRVFAFLLDFLIIVFSIFFLLIFSIMVLGENKAQYALYLVAIPLFFFYSLLFEIFNGGKSPGKAALRIRVVKINGQEATLNDFLTRWVFRMIDIYFSLGSVASFLVSSSDKNQRLGDILASTTLIRYRPDYSFNLSDLLNRASVENYEPKFPEVRKFREEDMLLVKTMIERIRMYPNQAHYEALNMLVDKIRTELNIKEAPKNKIEFLKIILKDYIVLTR